MDLNPIQNEALKILKEHHTLFGLVGVGHGKTLIGSLSATVIPCERPLYLAPPGPAKETRAKLQAYQDALWWLRVPRVEKYSALSSKSGSGMLDQIKPDLLILDEAHALKNFSSARTKRVKRYIRQYNPRVVAFSASMMHRSIKDFAHLLRWCVGDSSPLPKDYRELARWASVFDPKPWPEPSAQDIAIVKKRVGWGTSLADMVCAHPAVLTSSGASIDADLELSTLNLDVPDRITSLLRQLAETWALPGATYADPMHVTRALRELAMGYMREEVGTVPPSWLRARSEWHSAVRAYLPRARAGMDSPGLVWDACLGGHYPTAEIKNAWATWHPIHKDEDPKTRVVWVDPFLADYAQDWIKDHPKGLVWGDRALRERIGGVEPGDSPEPGRGALLSTHAHSEGLDLQAWNENLVLCPPPSSERIEQLIGRTHRQGQRSEKVVVQFCTHTPQLAADLQTARDLAEGIGRGLRQERRIEFGRWR